jgi:hypothetical protein
MGRPQQPRRVAGADDGCCAAHGRRRRQAVRGAKVRGNGRRGDVDWSVASFSLYFFTLVYARRGPVYQDEMQRGVGSVFHDKMQCAMVLCLSKWNAAFYDIIFTTPL